jgi:carbon-monoxide dehydrogenase small subunit
MKRTIRVTVNGRENTHEVEGRLLLVHYLRDVLGLTGTHVGCETSLCGACTILLNGRAVKACTLLAVQVDGAEVTTIEGLADGAGADGAGADGLHPVQRAFREEHGLQCGFCTPGMIMTAVQLLQDNPHPDEDEIRHGLEGNLCRCTGYQNIVRAVKSAAAELRG